MSTRVKTGSLAELLQWCAIDPITGCWEWQRSLIDGYGYVRLPDGKVTAAHRYSYETHTGTKLGALKGCHKCDNRKCINPEHVFPGTQQDNIDDKMAKGRGPDHRGVRNPKSKLTAAQVTEIRVIGKSQTFVRTARQFGVTPEQISNIVNKRNWI